MKNFSFLAFVFISFLLSGSHSSDAHARGFYSLGIKVESFFAQGSEQKIEGSGILVRSGNPEEFFVLTSEHVVLPNNGPAVHYVLVNNNWIEAEWVRSDWEKGLALLKVKTVPDFMNREREKFVRFRSLVHEKHRTGDDYLDIAYQNDPEYKGVRTFGVPAGSHAVRFSSFGEGVKALSPGEVLARTKVWSFRNIPTEAGMSGGPAFYRKVTMHGSPEAHAFFDRDGFIWRNYFVGLLTHITYSKELPTYVIPASVIEEWMGSTAKPVLSRGLKEFTSLYHGRDNPEIVVAESSGQRLIKVKGQFWVTLPTEGANLDEVAKVYPGLAKMGLEMRQNGKRSVRVTAIGGHELDNTDPLARLANLLTAESPVTLAK